MLLKKSSEGGTVVGGTRQPGDLNSDPDPSTHHKMLSDLEKTYPQILTETHPDGERQGTFKVFREVVGRRPIRSGGPRIEWDDGRAGLIHAYGLGGRGYECSWGVAETVRELVKRH